MNNKYKYLFLDRDGVINEERPNDYVKSISEFVFIEKALDAISILSTKFDKIFIITNQRGIGRQKMRVEDLNNVHGYMISEIEKKKGKIDKIYFCSDIESTSINRKPNIGMVFQAKNDYPEILYNQSIMVGNSLSDIQFGNKMSMFTILVGDKYSLKSKAHTEAKAYYNSLYEFAVSFKQYD